MDHVERWFQIIQLILTVAIGFWLFTVRQAFRAGQWVQDLTRLEARLNQAGDKLSTLATIIQRLPDDLRAIFVSRELFDARLDESLRERKELREELMKVRNKQ